MPHVRDVVPVLIVLVAAATLAFAAVTTFDAQRSSTPPVPATATAATQCLGQALFRLSEDGTTLTYMLIAVGREDGALATLHLRSHGPDGPPVVVLRDPHAPRLPVDDPLVDGTIRARDLRGPLAGQADLRTLVRALETGDAYIKLQTSVCPNGEIRGQIVRSDEEEHIPRFASPPAGR